jgi:hypothetical protein
MLVTSGVLNWYIVNYSNSQADEVSFFRPFFRNQQDVIGLVVKYWNRKIADFIIIFQLRQ